MEGNQWQEMDIFKVVKERKATLLLMNLAISSFQNRLAKQFGIKPGAEMIQGIESAKELNANLVLADRNIQKTFSRIWGKIGFKGKAMLLLSIFAGIFSKEDITEEELEKMKSQDMIDSMLQEFTKRYPKINETCIEVRTYFISLKIKYIPAITI